MPASQNPQGSYWLHRAVCGCRRSAAAQQRSTARGNREPGTVDNLSPGSRITNGLLVEFEARRLQVCDLTQVGQQRHEVVAQRPEVRAPRPPGARAAARREPRRSLGSERRTLLPAGLPLHPPRLGEARVATDVGDQKGLNAARSHFFAWITFRQYISSIQSRLSKVRTIAFRASENQSPNCRLADRQVPFPGAE